jgi:hypothetical protein
MLKPVSRVPSKKSISPRLEVITNRLSLTKKASTGRLNFKVKTKPISNESSASKSGKKTDCTVLQSSASANPRILNISSEYENPEIRISS